MKKKKEEPFPKKVISKLVENTYEPMHLLMGTNNELYASLQEGYSRMVNPPPNQAASNDFSVVRNGRNDGDYAYTLKFKREEKQPEPVLHSIALDFEGHIHEEKIGALRNLPSFYAMKERALSGQLKHAKQDRTIQQDGPDTRLKP